MSPEDEARAVLLRQYERTVEEASSRVSRYRSELAGVATEPQRTYPRERIERFSELVEETRAKADRTRAILGSPCPEG